MTSISVFPHPPTEHAISPARAHMAIIFVSFFFILFFPPSYFYFIGRIEYIILLTFVNVTRIFSLKPTGTCINIENRSSDYMRR